MYMEDRTPDNATTNLRADLLRDVVHNPGLRPGISDAVKQQFETKRQRLHQGYCPSSSRELLDWIKERVAVPQPEWQALLTAMARDTDLGCNDCVEELSARICLLRVTSDNSRCDLVVAIEQLPRVLVGFYDIAVTEHYSSESLPDGIELAALTPYSAPPAISHCRLDEDPQWYANTALAQWLSFYGPLTVAAVAHRLAIPVSRLTAVLDDLVESQTLITGHLLTGEDRQTICDAENFETLLRLQRTSAIPAFTALPCHLLPLFIAERQGLVSRGQSIDDVYATLELLRGLSLPAAQWEQSVLPARIDHCDPAWLDSLMQEAEFYWQGDGKQTVRFCFDDERELWATAAAESSPQLPETDIPALDKRVLALLQATASGLDFSQLLEQLRHDRELPDATAAAAVNAETLADALWRLVWQQLISNDAYAALRKGIQHQFSVTAIHDKPVARSTRRKSLRPGRSQYAKRHSSLPYIGRWFYLGAADSTTTAENDLLQQEDNARERARILLQRYGIVCRVLVGREHSLFAWRELFRALRLMELSGEVLAGQFFADVPGPQFISHEAFRRLQKPLPEQAIFWLNATDPASLCGIAVDQLKAALPKRLATTQLVYCGSELVIVSERGGKSLRIMIEADDKRLPECFAMFQVRLQRQFQADKRIIIETINGAGAIRSPYLDSLKLVFDVSADHKQVVLQRRYSA